MRQLVFSFLMSVAASAQNDSTVTYFEKMPNKISVDIFALNNSDSYRFDYRPSGTPAVVDLEPNKKTSLNVGVKYDFISFSFGFAPDFLSDKPGIDDSKMTSFSLNLLPGRFLQHLEFYYQKGLIFQVEDIDDYLYFNQMKSWKVGGRTSYLLNRNFSYRAIFNQNERQVKSAGSFAPGLSYFYSELDARRVPEVSGKITFFDVAANAAYYYNWVPAKNVLVAAALSGGIGFSQTNDEGDRFSSALYQGDLLLAPGYTSDTWFFGAMCHYKLANHNSDGKVSVNDNTTYVMAYVGYRFDAPEFLSSRVESVKEKNPLKKKTIE